MSNICQFCGKEIRIAIFRHEIYCSDICRKALGLDGK